MNRPMQPLVTQEGPFVVDHWPSGYRELVWIIYVGGQPVREIHAPAELA